MASKEYQELLRRLTAMPGSRDLTIEEARTALEELMASFAPTRYERPISREHVMVESLPAQWISTPGALDNKIILFLHGGGFIRGSVESHIDLIVRLSSSLKARVLATDYRLAPEHPFPAAVEDSLTSYRWLLRSGAEPEDVIVAGISAGGGLVISTLIAMRENGEPLPAAGLCFSPFVDLTLQGNSQETNSDKDWETREVLEKMVTAYMAGADPAQPLASPIFGSFAGLPPLFIQAGEYEILLDDSRRLASSAMSDEVYVDLDVWPEMTHSWQLFGSVMPEARAAISSVSCAVLGHIEHWNPKP